ncbi:hypothetical protein JYT19_00810, partial [Sulfobacillus acidophilus]|nr:hypothetical protein [Sulfobacillus acidophilus]
MLKTNFLKQNIKQNKLSLGIWNTLASPMVTEVLAAAGLDFIFIDLEHGPFDINNLHLYIDKCENNSCSPIVRLPAKNDWLILQALDQGAHGIIIPQVSDAKETRDIVQAVKYFPKGKRGFTPFTKAGGFNNFNTKKYYEAANNLTLTGIIIEDLHGIENLDEILKIEELDIIY